MGNRQQKFFQALLCFTLAQPVLTAH